MCGELHVRMAPERSYSLKKSLVASFQIMTAAMPELDTEKTPRPPRADRFRPDLVSVVPMLLVDMNKNMLTN